MPQKDKKRNVILKISDFVEVITRQGDYDYNFGYDVAQKILFVLTVLLMRWMPYDEYDAPIFIVCMVVGRIRLMSWIEIGINAFIGERKKNTRFLHMPEGIWKIIVFIFMLCVLIKTLCLQRSFEDGLMVFFPILSCCFCGFFIYGGQTRVIANPPDPNKVGTEAWKKANGVVKVNRSLMDPLYRDKYGNYYQGTSFVPVSTPVDIVNKK